MSINSNYEVPQNWDFFFCRVEGKPASVRVNLALRQIAPVEGYKYRLNFLIKMQNPTPEGMSSNEEYPVLCDIEDAISGKAEQMGAISAGAVKSGGILELIYYTNLSEGLPEACVDELAAFEGYQYKSYFEEDPEWKDYFEFLFPDPYSYQSMQNRRVVMQLEENGDNLDIPREIDHWIYFDNEQSRAQYVEKVIRKGYKVVSEDFIENARKQIPELPIEKRIRYLNDYKLSEDDARILTTDRDLSEYFDELVKLTKDAKKSCSYITTILLAMMNESENIKKVADLKFEI